MSKRPKFEQMNYPEEPKSNWLVILFVSAIIIGVAYFAYNYWYQCTDFGFLKFCSMVQKP